MKIIYAASLAQTLDALNEAFFFGHSLSKTQRNEVAKWLASRHGLPYSYANMFAPTEADYRHGVRLFTGETVRSGAATAHILGEEVCRALILLGVKDKIVGNALEEATRGMLERLNRPECNTYRTGIYCCGTCSASFWRHLSVGGLTKHEQILDAGMKTLKRYRLGDGKWRRFPFYYTLLALSEIDNPGALAEMRYAAPVLEKMVNRAARNKFGQRRKALAERILAKC